MVLKNDEFATEKSVRPSDFECLNCMSKLTIRKNIVVTIIITTIKLNIVLDLNTIDYIRKFSL